MIAIRKEDREILKKIISRYPYKFFVYGSRTKRDFRTFSDLDVCYKEEIPDSSILSLKEELEESDLSIIVELSNWRKMSSKFQKIIEKDLIEINWVNTLNTSDH